ncbi:hypothetical protein T484DRAFT_1842071 [Baffinella frigidus]|nr:hypothetical protein T484DRAFT_1842071 [Cryptophyta sp. CCMP2293]
MRLCPCCSKPVALQECCPIGKIPPGIKTDQHKWVRFGGLGDLVDATLGEGGYKELFRKEKLVGKVLFGKTRKTLSDLFKRIGVRNVKHRDLLVESIHDLGRQQEPLSEEQSMQERFVLVRNSWTDKRRPEIQLQALADLYQETQDPAKLASLKTLGICALLRDVLAGQMQDLELEKQLVERQLEIDGLWERRRNRELDYMQKKELDRTEHLQAKDWVQWKADFGSLAVVGFLIVQNLSASPIFRPELTSGDFPTLMAVQLDKCREAETHVNLLRMSQAARGPFVPLVVSEVAEQQLTVLTAVLHLSKEEAGRVALVEQGVAVAVVKVARAASVRDSAREVVAVRILCNLSLTNGNTERTMVQQLLYYAITTLANLAFVQENRDDILAAGALGPLKELLRRGDPEQVLKTIDTIRNLAAARADLKLARATVPDLTAMVLDEADKFGAEHKLRAMIALRSISRFEESLEHLERNGTLRMAANIARDSLDPRLRSQALGLLYNVAGLSAQPPLDPEEEDFTDEEDDDEEMAPDDEDAAEAEAAGGGGAEAEGEGEGASGEAGEGEGGMAGGAAAEEGRSPGSGKDDGGKPIKRANHVLQRRTSPFFKLLTERELQLLALKGTYLDLEKGEVLVMQGDSTDRMFAVVRGIMRVLITMGGTKLPLRTRESKLEKLLKSQKKSEGCVGSRVEQSGSVTVAVASRAGRAVVVPQGPDRPFSDAFFRRQAL